MQHDHVIENGLTENDANKKCPDKKVVLVTGGGFGLGRVLVDFFYREGYKVALTYRKHREETDRAVQESGGQIVAIKADCR